MSRRSTLDRNRRHANVRRSRRIVLAWTGILALTAVGAVAWIGIRFALSYNELKQAQAQAKTIISEISADPVKGSHSAAGALDTVAGHLSTAQGMTSDPVWRAAEVLPFAGDNLRAYRLTVAGLSSAVGEGLRPVAPAVGNLTSALSLTDGRVDVAAVSESASSFGKAAGVLKQSQTTLAEASSVSAVAPLADGVKQARTMVDQVSETVSTLSVTAKVLPAALGADGSKRYGLLFNNNAELRTTGGIAGAISELTAVDGAIDLGRQLTPMDFTSTVEVTPEENTLFGQRLGSYIQNVNLTPDFVRTGELTSKMWQGSQGDALDGVISIDTVTISRLLAATGPVTVDGRELTAENATRVLLSDVYQQIPDRTALDVFFANVTSAMYQKVLHSGVPATELVKALSQATSEGRISLWFADPSLQSVIADGPLAGPLAQLKDDGSPVGVFFADGTAGKMDFYLDGSLSASTTCDAKQGQTITTTATLHSSAPVDILSQPWENRSNITGEGQSDTAPGSIRTMVQFAGTESLRPVSVTVNGNTEPLVWKMIADRPIAIAFVDVAPGESATLTADFLVLPGYTPTIDTIIGTPTSTPFVHTVERGSCG